MNIIPSTSALLIVALILGSLGQANANNPLQVTFGSNGIRNLTFAGETMVAEPLRPRLRNIESGGSWGNYVQAFQSRMSGRTQHLDFGDFSVKVEYAVSGNTLDMTITYKNLSDLTMDGVEFIPFDITFSRRPRGGNFMWGYDHYRSTDGSPGVLPVVWENNKLLICRVPGSDNPADFDFDRPIRYGFHRTSPPVFSYPFMIQTRFPEGLVGGEEWVYTMSLRFAPSDTPDLTLVKDIYEPFLEKYPPILAWEDRRPIGALFLANSNTGWKTNPRGYLNEPSIDVTNEIGREAFATRMIAFAERAVQVTKAAGGQGVLVWDIEGGEMPHAITYLGDPRVLPEAAPEMDAIADEFFEIFWEAGLKSGICIRPSKVVQRPDGRWAHRQVDDPVAEMSDKIRYAKERWGCEIFYIDTNVVWPLRDLKNDFTRGMWQGNSRLLTTDEIYELARLHPDVFIFTEFGLFGYEGAVGVYGELRAGNTRTSPTVRQLYPDAARVIAVGDGDYLGRWNELLDGASRGDIQIFRGWFGDRVNPLVKQLYEEADFIRKARQLKPEGSVPDQLANEDPHYRYAAVEALPKLNEAQARFVAQSLTKETHPMVKRAMITKLGESGHALGAPAIAPYLQTDQGMLYLAAAPAMGMLGKAGTPYLIEVIKNQPNSNYAKAALRGLANNDDPTALPVIMPYSQSPDSEIRQAAIAALGARPTKESVAHLIDMLQTDDPDVLIPLCRALGRTRDRSAMQPLLNLMGRSVRELKDNNVRAAAAYAMEAISGLQYGVESSHWSRAIAANDY
jgi:HEAT repeat protein